MKPETKIISAAMYDLAETIQSGDGVANAACAQAAERLDLQTIRIRQLETAIREVIEDNLHLADGEVCTLIKLKRAIGYT
ncbi:hypothetical protein [uncultured Zhongshania sp.]|uniref:hypothetical protein n=1 Tax=uncultured Zhongshania sp. TaxID=1642288 RepID=UPI0030D8F079